MSETDPNSHTNETVTPTKKPAEETPKTTTMTTKKTVPVVAATPANPERKSHKAVYISIGIVLGILLILGLGITSGMLIQTISNKQDSSPALTSTQDGNNSVTQQESDIASVAAKVGPSVVSVITQTQSQSYYGSATTGEGAGTGIIVSKDGYVMTNNHVVQDATTVSVVDSDGNLYNNVTVIGRDPLNDIAFLKISANKSFTAATLGNSSTIRIGQQVVAIGNALGQYSNTVTSGIISGTGRPVTADSGNGQTETLTDLIQTDASINPGNSGGPLLNMSGQVIGINTAIVQDANGIGFAIPINSTKGVLAGVLENGKVSRAYLGVNYLTVTPDVARQYNLSVKQGAYVYANQGTSAVASGSPADKAGLQSGDVITKVNDITIGTDGSLSSVIGEFKPGDTVTVTYLRNGQTQTTQVTFSAYQQ